ncbi:MAG: pyridoxal-phosphate dependent enzyme [Candidatus Peregrinibacteria bacterium]|nr:pyridoxal-phosphate dependent enzyme [Candidatus Peregrinibacteria bacterium]
MLNGMHLQCTACTSTASGDVSILTCPHHSQYYSYLEVIDGAREAFSLYGEGSTPVQLFSENIYVKDESKNPTGSVKDREVAGIFRHVLERGLREVSIVSAGNGALSAAYYAKHAGVKLHCFVSKMTSRHVIEHLENNGATVHLEDGDYEEIFKKNIDSNPYYNITPGINPFAEEGTKFIAHELVEQVSGIAAVVVPVGNGTQLSAIWKGFKELSLKKLPMMIGVEIEGCDPVYHAHQDDEDFVELNTIPDTKATGIAARCAFTSPKAVRALRESGGMIVRITEKELEDAMLEVENNSSFTCGPTSASAFAALKKISIDGNIVCILSGKR